VTEPVVTASDVRVSYRVGRRRLLAVDGVDLVVPANGRIGIIGESGSGKSTLAKALVGLVQVHSGEVRYAGGTRVTARSRPQPGVGGTTMMFQDAALALNPRLPLWLSVAEAIEPRRMFPRQATKERALELLRQVGIGTEMSERRPSALSGGQRQRVTLARSLANQGKALFCDEPVASLDVSLQASLLRLIGEVTRGAGLACVIISHDLVAVAGACDQLVVMYLGQVVESGPSADVISNPRHPYTRALIAAIPQVGRRRIAHEAGIAGEVGDPLNPPTGCRFRTRCPYARAACETPVELEGLGSHAVRCRFWREVADALREQNSEAPSIDAEDGISEPPRRPALGTGSTAETR
jgi:peptide/nickel transport system ATP-binding protein